MANGSIQVVDLHRTLFVFLIFAHIIADFLIQTNELARGKKTSVRTLLLHGLLSYLIFLIILSPFMSKLLILSLAILSGVHILIDALKVQVDMRWNKPVTTFIADQILHVTIIFLFWLVLVEMWILEETWFSIPREWLYPLSNFCIVSAGYIFNGKGGTILVRSLLERYPDVLPVDEKGGTSYSMGLVIGILERFLTYTLILLGEWSALGFILAAKSIARFRELENQSFADYYLIGTLMSISVAVATGVVVSALIR